MLGPAGELFTGKYRRWHHHVPFGSEDTAGDKNPPAPANPTQRKAKGKSATMGKSATEAKSNSKGKPATLEKNRKGKGKGKAPANPPNPPPFVTPEDEDLSDSRPTTDTYPSHEDCDFGVSERDLPAWVRWITERERYTKLLLPSSRTTSLCKLVAQRAFGEFMVVVRNRVRVWADPPPQPSGGEEESDHEAGDFDAGDPVRASREARYRDDNERAMAASANVIRPTEQVRFKAIVQHGTAFHAAWSELYTKHNMTKDRKRWSDCTYEEQYDNCSALRAGLEK